MADPTTYDLPTDRHYDRQSHLWALRDAETGRVRVGIDAIGLDALGELAYVALQEVGDEVARGAPLGTLEAAKMTTGIAAPVTGAIVARNHAVLTDPLTVNRDPYGTGWLVEIAAVDWDADAAAMIGGDAIPGWAAAERERLESES